MCRAKGYVFFQLFWSEIGYQFRPFWSEKGYGLCTLVLNWVCFLEELATSSSFGNKTISPLNLSLSQQENTQTLGAARFKPSARFITEKLKDT